MKSSDAQASATMCDTAKVREHLPNSSGEPGGILTQKSGNTTDQKIAAANDQEENKASQQ